MGSNQSSDKFTCNRFIDGRGPPSLEHQVNRINRDPGLSQPDGQMTWVILHKDLPGFRNVNTLQINFTFPDGIQKENQPHPGQPYAGLRLCAYLPENKEGWKVLRLLNKAFHQQLLFTVATNRDGEDVVTTGPIPLKTQQEGGSRANGYPDEEYLKSVTKLLKDKCVK